MNRLERLHKQLADLLQARKADQDRINEFVRSENDLEDDDAAEHDDILAGWAAREAEIDKLGGEIQALAEIANAPERSKLPGFEVTRKADQQDLLQRSVMELRGADLHAATQRTLDNVDLEDRYKGDVEKLLRRFRNDERLGRHIVATGREVYERAFTKYIMGQGDMLDEEERRAVAEARAGGLTDAAGGYLVPFTLDPTIIDTATHLGFNHPWREFANVIQVTTDNWQGVAWGGITASMVGEATEATDGMPTLTQPAITVKKAQAFVPFSVEIDMDAPQLQNDIRSGFAWAKMDLEDTQFALGAGTGNNVNGIVTDLVAAGGSYIIASNGSNTFTTNDVYALEAALPRRFFSGAGFVANHTIYSQIRQFDTGGGNALWARIADGQPEGLLARPTYESQNMDSTYGSGENYVMIFGNGKAGYNIIDRIGMTVEFIPHLFGGTNNYPTGQRGLYMYWRFGAKVVNLSALRLLNIT